MRTRFRMELTDEGLSDSEIQHHCKQVADDISFGGVPIGERVVLQSTSTGEKIGWYERTEVVD